MSKKNHGEKAATVPATRSLFFLFSLAFLEGALVIFSELLGAKMMASFFGNSLAVWTAVICVTISFLTLGYFLGGMLSKRPDKLNVLALLFSLAGFFMAIMPSWSLVLFEKFGDSSLVGGSIATTIFLIGPSVLCLGMTSPVIIQLLNEQQRDPGKSAGQNYAVSTLAGIIATLVLGLYLLPVFGLKIPIITGAIILVAVSLLTRFTYLNMVTALVLCLVFFNLVREKEEDNKLLKTIFVSEGLMGQLKVISHNFAGSDESFRVLLVNGIPQTIIHNEKNATSFWQYPYRISAVASLKKGKNALLIGLGGGAIANELQQLDIKLDIVDIDKRMYGIAQDYFYFKPRKTTRFICDDARHFIKTTRKKYDFIVIDICSGEVQPTNVFTKEGIRELKQLVSEDGIILIQYQEKINPARISGSQSIARTFISNGFKTYQNVEKSDISGVILACSPRSINFSDIDSTRFTPGSRNKNWMAAYLREPFTPITQIVNGVLLTDDKPMLEQINAETIEAWRKVMNKNYGLRVIDK